jgi:hypothetical protein
MNNFVGLTANGVSAVPNRNSGLVIQGDYSVVSSNFVVGNNGHGLHLAAAFITAQGNTIGMSYSGNFPLPNLGVGIFVFGTYNLIGGSRANEGNIIVSNILQGITVQGAQTIIMGNFIGTDRSGTLRRPNLSYGVVSSAIDTVIGGVEAGQGNVIVGEKRHAIVVTRTNASIIGNNVSFSGEDCVRLEGPDARVQHNRIFNCGANGINIYTNRKPAFLFNNSITKSGGAGIAFGDVGPLLSNPLLHNVDEQGVSFSVNVPANQSYFYFDLYGNPSSALIAPNDCTELIAHERFFVGNLYSGGRLFSLTTNAASPQQYGSVTAHITFEKLGSTGLSNALAVVNDTRACTVCRCYNHTVDCRDQV